MRNFEFLLDKAVAAHGHLCPGQVIGVRMALLGCKLVGSECPIPKDQIKKMIIYVEIDRCATDAISCTTGVKLGRRSLKFMDYGIMAATFLRIDTKQAYRIISKESSRDKTSIDIFGTSYTEEEKQILTCKLTSDDDLFYVQKVKVPMSKFDLPGHAKRKITCSVCGQIVRDQKEVLINGRFICKPCSGESYFVK